MGGAPVSAWSGALLLVWVVVIIAVIVVVAWPIRR